MIVFIPPLISAKNSNKAHLQSQIDLCNCTLACMLGGLSSILLTLLLIGLEIYFSTYIFGKFNIEDWSIFSILGIVFSTWFVSFMGLYQLIYKLLKKDRVA